jgi:hypothetical protein
MRGACFLLIALAGVSGGLAQDEGSDNAIHAITTLHEDGTKTVTITDPDKRTSEASTYDARDKLIQKIIYALDDNNRPATGVVYAKDNSPVLKTVYKHDDMNRLSEEDDYTMDDQLIRRFVYEFGPNGKVSRIRAFDAQGNELQQSPARKDVRQSLPRIH